MRCTSLVVLAEELIATHLLWETLNALCFDKDGEPLWYPSGFGVLFLFEEGGLRLQAVEQRSKL